MQPLRNHRSIESIINDIVKGLPATDLEHKDVFLYVLEEYFHPFAEKNIAISRPSDTWEIDFTPGAISLPELTFQIPSAINADEASRRTIESGYPVFWQYCNSSTESVEFWVKNSRGQVMIDDVYNVKRHIDLTLEDYAVAAAILLPANFAIGFGVASLLGGRPEPLVAGGVTMVANTLTSLFIYTLARRSPRPKNLSSRYYLMDQPKRTSREMAGKLFGSDFVELLDNKMYWEIDMSLKLRGQQSLSFSLRRSINDQGWSYFLNYSIKRVR